MTKCDSVSGFERQCQTLEALQTEANSDGVDGNRTLKYQMSTKQAPGEDESLELLTLTKESWTLCKGGPNRQCRAQTLRNVLARPTTTSSTVFDRKEQRTRRNETTSESPERVKEIQQR